MSQPAEAFRNAFKIPELKSRIIFTLIMLAVYRLGAHVPTPGVDGGALSQAMGTGGLLSFYDMFSGGRVQHSDRFPGSCPTQRLDIIHAHRRDSSLFALVRRALRARRRSRNTRATGRWGCASCSRCLWRRTW